MLPFSSWDVISGTDSGRLILGVDCSDAWPGEAGLAELAARLGGAYHFLRLALGRRTGPGWHPSGAARADSWFEPLRQEPRRVAAVLGHRVGGVYAAKIAEAVACWQGPPVIILFDPEVASAGLLARTLDAEIAANSALLSAAEIDRARRITAEISGRRVTGAEIADEILTAYLEIISVPWERTGLGDVRNSEFTKAFEARVSWLAAAAQFDPSRVWRRSTAIISNQYPVSSGDAGSAEEARGFVGRQIAFDVGRAGLLRSAAVADAVLELLEGRSKCQLTF